MITNSNTAWLGYSFALLIVLLTFSCLETPSARADVRTVTVGVYENAPKVFTSESGKPSGLFIDIIEHIAKIEGWNLRYVSGTWAEGLERLAKGEIDLMPDVAYTTDREKIYSFHEVPVLSSWSQVYAPKDSNIQSILDLNGKRIAVLEYSIQQKTFERLTNSFGSSVTLISVPDYKTMFEMVARGGADAAITNRFYGLQHARKSGLEDTAVMFDPAELFFAAPRNDPKQLFGTIDRHLGELKQNSQSAYYASLKRWTSEEVQFKFPAWLQILGPVVGIVLLMSLVGSFVLKHQVDARTRELKQINQEMEQRIAERTIELTAANIKLQEVDKLKSMFIASMSHELRTPLNSIIGFTGIILQGMAGELNEEQRDQLQRVSKAGKHLLALITDVIDISKIEAGKIEAYAEEFQIDSLLKDVLSNLKLQIREKGLEIEVSIVPDKIILRTDRKRLFQSVLNYLSNAVKFTEKGKITIFAEEKGDVVQLSVTDTGIGIKEEDLPMLFQSFVRLDSPLKMTVTGTGLGLYLTKKLVTEVLGGEVSATSTYGKGSTFTLSIPKDLSNKQSKDLSPNEG